MSNTTNGTVPVYDLKAIFDYQAWTNLDTAFMSEIIAVNVLFLVLVLVFFRQEPLKSRGIIPHLALSFMLISNCVRIATNFTTVFITLSLVPIQIGALSMVWIGAITQWVRYLLKQHREYNKQNNSNATIVQKIFNFVFVSNAGLFLFLFFATFCLLLVMMGIWLSLYVTLTFSSSVLIILIVIIILEIAFATFLILSDLIIDVYRYGFFTGTYTLRDPLNFKLDGIFLLICCACSACYVIFSNVSQSYMATEGITQRVVGLRAPEIFFEHVSRLVKTDK